MLAVIKNKEEGFGMQNLKEYFNKRTVRLRLDTKYFGNSLRNERRIAERSKFYKPHTVHILFQPLTCDLLGQSCLSNAACASQRHQAMLSKPSFDTHYITLAPNETRKGNW